MIKRIITVMFVFACFLFADYGESFLYVKCDKKNKVVEIEPLTIYNEELDRIYPAVEKTNGIIKQGSYELYNLSKNYYVNTECRMDDVSVKIKYYKFGDLEVYENGKLKIFVPKEDLYYMYPYQIRFDAKTHKWEKYCSKKIGKDCTGIWNELNNTKKAENNDTKPFRVLEHFDFEKINAKLYKPLLNNNEKVCSLVKENIDNDVLSRKPVIKFRPKIIKMKLTLPDGKVIKKAAYFDFNNDGIKDYVFWKGYYSHYMKGNVIFVKFGDKNKTQKKEFNLSDIEIFPCQFDKSVKKTCDCPPVSQNADEAGIEINCQNGKKVFFRGRYTALLPFIYNGRTYLMITSSSYDTRDYVGVIYPEGKNSYKPVCLFKREK